MGSKFGHSVYSRRQVLDYIQPEWQCIQQEMELESGIRKALSREESSFHDDVILVDSNNQFLGLISALALVRTQSRFLHEKTTKLETQQDELREANRRLTEVLEELQRTQTQMVQQERLRALGEMAAGIAHDFNNTLTPILGYSELLLTQQSALQNPEKLRKYLNTIHVAAGDAARIIGRLREFYRPREAGECNRAVSLNEIVAQTISMTQPKWKNQAQAKGVNISMQTELSTLPLAGGNEAELREALTNIIFNAVDAMPGGGTITIRTVHNGNRITLEVSDTGSGMTAEVRRRCMEPFFSTKGERGSGLGMAVVFGIVKRHEGSIELDSVIGKGTSIRIHLPLKQARAAITSERLPAITQPIKILVVDDEPVVCCLIHDLLVLDAHQVDTATNGDDALAMVRAQAFDIIFTDRSMPQMSGDQLALAFKAVAPQTPVIMLTGFGEFMNASRELPDGVDLVLSKPPLIRDLRGAIRNLTNGTNQENPTPAISASALIVTI